MITLIELLNKMDGQRAFLVGLGILIGIGILVQGMVEITKILKK